VKVEHPGNAQPCSIGINKSLTVPGGDCEATLDPVAGKSRNVLRIIPAATVVALLVAGCGGSSRPDRSATRGVPRTLASEWANQASAVASAAAAGHDCQAAQLAATLRTDVIEKESRVPARLQPALLAGVNALADRIVCKAPPQTVTVTPSKPPKPPDKHDRHDHHKHGDKQGKDG
jgi:hypothetical protein